MTETPANLPSSHRPAGPAADLPPLEPPTAGFIVQLFVIPAFIVGLVIAVWVLFGKLAGGDRSPEEYVRTLRQDPSPERRWRAAYDLAQLIQNSRTLRKDQGVSLELAAALQNELDREAKRQEKTGGKAGLTREEKQLEQYLALAVGLFENPSPYVGRVLCQAIQPLYHQDVRSAALWSLARLGERDPKFSALNPEVLPALEEASRPAAPPPEPDLLREPVSDAFGRAALDSAEDTPEQRQAAIRKLAVFALGGLGDPEAIPALKERLRDANPEVCYHAAIALAQLGSAAGMPVLKEMLDESALKGIRSTRTDDQKRSIIMDDALKALSKLIEKDPNADLRPVRGELERLARGDLPAQIRVRAQEVLNLLKAQKPPATARR